MACLPVINIACNPLAEAAASSAARRFIEELAAQAAQAAADVMRLVVSGWLSLPSPNVSQDDGPVAALRAYTNWAVAAIAVGAVLVVALRMAWERNGREAGSGLRGIVTLVVLAGAGVPAVQLLNEVGDSYSTWILDKSADGDLGRKLLLLTPAASASVWSGITPLLVLGLSLMMMLVTIVQFLLLLARSAGLVVLAGLLPLAGAAGITGGGRAVRDRYLSWLLAFLLYKPAAATIYAAAFWTLGAANNLTSLLTGVVMLCMAIVALPALMRLIAPAVSAVTSNGSAGTAGAAAGAGVQVASGAIRLAGSGGTGSGGGGQGGGPAGQSGPVGAGPSTPMAPTPMGGGAGQAATPAAAGGATSAGSSGAAAGAGAGAAGAGAGAAAAAGPVGAAVAAGAAVAQAGPAAVRRVGGVAGGAVEGDR